MKSTTTGNISKKIAKILIRIGAVIINPNKPFKFDSGLLSPIYIDNRYLISFPKERKIIINEFCRFINKINKPDVIAGLATAGIPHAAWLAEKLNLPMIYLRSKPKDHGRKNLIEGKFEKGKKVLIVEDLISTAGTSVKAIKAIKKAGGIVKDEFAIYNHNLAISNKRFNKQKINLHCLVDTEIVSQIAHEQGMITKYQFEIVKNWVNDPHNWGKRMGIE